MDCKYILLNSDKQPMHKFKDGVGAKSWDEVKDFDNIGMIVPEPFIVLDFDTASDAQIMLRIIEDLGLKCRVMKTTRGIHVWFRSSEPWKNFTKTRNAIGIYADCPTSLFSRRYTYRLSIGELADSSPPSPTPVGEGLPRSSAEA